MAAPPKTKDEHRKRYLGDKEVKPILCVNYHIIPKYNVLGGAVDGEVVLNSKGIPKVFQTIGELR